MEKQIIQGCTNDAADEEVDNAEIWMGYISDWSGGEKSTMWYEPQKTERDDVSFQLANDDDEPSY